VPLSAAALDAELWDAARRAFTKANARRLAVRMVALTLDELDIAESQLDLWEGAAEAAAAAGASDQPAGALPAADLAELRAPGAGAAGQAEPPQKNAVSARPVPLRRLPGPSTSTKTPAAEPHAACGLQDAIDRIRSRWGVRGVVRGSGLALSGSRPRGPRPAPSPSSPAPAPS
jgi:hypothetical protein